MIKENKNFETTYEQFKNYGKEIITEFFNNKNKYNNYNNKEFIENPSMISLMMDYIENN